MSGGDTLYGGTHDLLTRDLPRLGIEVTFVDPQAPQSWKAQLRRTTGAVYFETLSDGLLRMSVGLEATDDLLEDLAQALG